MGDSSLIAALNLSGAAGWEVAAPLFFFAAVLIIGAAYLWWPRA